MRENMDEWLDERLREKLVERFGDRVYENRAFNIANPRHHAKAKAKSMPGRLYIHSK